MNLFVILNSFLLIFQLDLLYNYSVSVIQKLFHGQEKTSPILVWISRWVLA